MEIVKAAPRSAMAVTPHPDDCEGGCGATLAKWIEQSGTEVVIVLCTNGDKGATDRGMTPARLATIREKEQQEAAEVMGAAAVVFLSYPDGGLEDTLLFRSQVVRAIRTYKPEVVMCIDPYRTVSHTHRDHRMSGQVALDSAFTYAWNPLQFPDQITEEGLEPHKVSQAFLWGSESPDIAVDVTGFVEAKAESLSRHVSQVGRRSPEERLERMERWASRSAEEVGVPFSENFRRIRFDLQSKNWRFMHT